MEQGRLEKGTVNMANGVDKTKGLSTMVERGQWGGKVEFLLTCIGYAVGLGNIWRFPYLCFRHGGGTFLVPYIIMLVFVGLPIFFYELSLGQFCSTGPLSFWKINPLFKGLGFSWMAIIWMAGLYYNVLIGWGFYFLFASMTSVVPWTYCDNDWNTPACLEGPQMKELRENGTFKDWLEERNLTVAKTPSEEYFYEQVLEISSGLEEPGKPVLGITLCLLLSWLCCFLALIKGVRSLGKVMYVVTIFPYIMMTVLVVRGATLEGASTGVSAYLSPDFGALANAQVWSDAATQIFFTLGTCSGGVMTMASFNDFHHPILRDSIIVPIINGITSLYSGFAIFSVLGFMANLKGVDVKDVAADGPGLVFVVYPEALSQMPAPPVWSILFFIMLITLGYSSVFSMVEAVFVAIMDSFPRILRKNEWRPIIFRGVCCIIYFFLTLPMVTNGGFYLFYLTDACVTGFPMLVTGFLEFAAIVWIYGFNRLADDIAMMIGKKPNIYFKVCWIFITPIFLLCIFVVRAIQYKPLTFGAYKFTDVGNALTWLEVSFLVCWIPLYAIGLILKEAKILQVIQRLVKPRPSWGPAKPIHRTGRYATQHETADKDVIYPSTDIPISVIPDYQPHTYHNQSYIVERL